MNAVKSSNALFDNDEHHDSHEFVNWLMDKVHEDFLRNHSANSSGRRNQAQAAIEQGPATSFIQELF